MSRGVLLSVCVCMHGNVCACTHTHTHTQVLLLCYLYVQCVLSAHCITLHTDMNVCAHCTFWMILKGKHEIASCHLFILCQTGLFGGIPFTPGGRSYKVWVTHRSFRGPKKSGTVKQHSGRALYNILIALEWVCLATFITWHCHHQKLLLVRLQRKSLFMSYLSTKAP